MDMQEKIKQSIEIRGICAALQAMDMPQWINLNEMVNRFGFRIIEADADNRIRGKSDIELTDFKF